MNAGKLFALLLASILAVAPLQAEKKPKKPDVPEVMSTAKTVAVISREGTESDLRVGTEERIAIACVRDALKAWGRYTVVPDSSQADVILVVRKGKTQQSQLAKAPGREQNNNTRTPLDMGSNGDMSGIAAQARTGISSDLEWSSDTLSICLRDAKGKVGSPLWSRAIEGGLDGARPILVDQLHAAVDKAFPPAAPKP